MPLIFGSFQGNTVYHNGKCYSFITSAEITGAVTPDVPLSAVYSDCNACSSALESFTPPSGESLSLGDMHYVYGDPTVIATSPTQASLNVDDNSSTNEIIWWTHTEGSVEYFISYTQQDFTFTAGGKSIDQITVSASDGSISDVYTLTTPQSATLRNGGSWSNGGVSGLGTGINFNITERIIPEEDCCNLIDGYYALFNLSVSPATGFHNIDEYGGALWYIWKKASTFASTPINTASSAGMDGVGAFLNGLDGYTARSDFESPGTLASIRESYDAVSATNAMDRLVELAGTTGTWDADWDPLVSDPINCPTEFCGTPNGDPTVFITLSWTDSDVTKSWLGCTWCNGETKEVYSTNYFLDPGGFTVPSERWEVNYLTAGNELLVLKTSDCAPLGGENLMRVRFDGRWFECAEYRNSGCSPSPTPSVCAGDLGPTGDFTVYPCGCDEFTETLPNSFFDLGATTDHGVTIEWSRGNGW